jgi:signal transduction histidine kinase
MWPYTGEESRWLARPEFSLDVVQSAPAAAKAPLAALIAKPAIQQAPSQDTAKAEQAGWLTALDRLFKSPDKIEDQSALPLVAARLKDPLNAIRDSARTLRGNPNLSAAQREQFLDVVLRENDHLAEMISAMLDRTETDTSHKAHA